MAPSLAPMAASGSSRSSILALEYTAEEIRFDGPFGQEVFDSREPLPWR